MKGTDSLNLGESMTTGSYIGHSHLKVDIRFAKKPPAAILIAKSAQEGF